MSSESCCIKVVLDHIEHTTGNRRLKIVRWNSVADLIYYEVWEFKDIPTEVNMIRH